ncbi:hydroxypyruvate isomerase family protein [Bordetella sp. BOR01]|uniref:hydroxypyruvate isomerase family protein n=1 Tax=Bordetella sp. BOR01 TaxID=2854779 RepID=UPI001C496AD2|nr:TIM barrel protein [Bordetella sp. BOR01]MBV7486708.1 TIM barrel protein [Bordetella sp. BOR01]
MKLAANLSLLYPGLPLARRIEEAARDGFAGAEILFPYDLPPAELAMLLQAQGMALVLVNTPPGREGEKGLACLPGREADFDAALAQALDVCRATGCRSIHVMAGRPPEGAARTDCQATLVGNLQRAAPLAARDGITLTLEALNRHDMPGYFYRLPEQAAQVIAQVGHPAVRLQFDFYHCQREGLDLDRALRAALPLVHHVQFAHPQGRHEPDPADPAVAQALRTLADSGYAGWIGCEYLPRADTRAGLAWREAYQAAVAGRA